MAVSKKFLAHMTKRKLKFEVVPHKKVFTAYDLAQTLGEKLENIAKTLLVKVELPKIEKQGTKFYVVAVPASYRVNLKAVQKYLKALKTELATEVHMKKLGMTPGAGTPIVSMYKDVGLLIDHQLANTQKALIGAESFTDSLRVKMKDLIKSEGAHVAKIGEKGKLKLQVHMKKAVKKGKKKMKKIAKKIKKIARRKR
jgi:prolyl-tRNA editing enzyme YbaK/EbsC (Cys-tRNA(Pro) deacylase)